MIKDYDIVFCDSKEALDKLYTEGLDKNSTIITKSPTILAQNNKNFINIEKHATLFYRKKHLKNSRVFSNNLFVNLQKDKITSKYSKLVAHKFIEFYNKIYFASLMKDYYFEKDICLVVPVSGDEIMKNAMSSSIYDIIKYYPRGKIEYVNVSTQNERSIRGDSNISIFSRLKFVGYIGIIWNYINLFSNLLKKKNKIAIINYNELVRDISVSLFLSNKVSIKYYRSFFNLKNNKIIKFKNINKKVFSISDKIFYKAISDINSPIIKQSLHKMWNDELYKLFNNYHLHYNSALNLINRNRDIKLILTGYLGIAEGIALKTVCNNNNIPLVSCQHGVTREILNDINIKYINFETNYCNNFFCFNKTSKMITENSILIDKETKINVIGMPSDYSSFKLNRNKSNKICYISTILLSGGRPNFIAPSSDLDLIKWECSLIEKVLNKLNFKIDYKPYPAMRYNDSDITMNKVRESNNLEIIGTHVDLRYIIGKYKLLITSGATSTLSWCVKSGTPLIFINRRGSMEINSQVLREFKDAFFVFNDSDKGWKDKLKLFLELPYENIYAKWEKKIYIRKKIIKKYFGDSKLNAAKIGKDKILDLIGL
jgi:hypothetical protein